ncbi:hypothetical protein BGX29_007643 [Mortierella sp. GBA35]|nr:hypothetical protein BGX29_007643 [Mortierella sp. GBA35]
MRRQSYLYCVGLRDLAEALRAFDPKLAESCKLVLDLRVERLMIRLKFEDRAFNRTEESARVNAKYVRRNHWFMYYLSLELKRFTDTVPRPEGRGLPGLYST